MTTQQKIEKRIYEIIPADTHFGPIAEQLIFAISIVIAEEMNALLEEFENYKINTNQKN